MEILTEMKCYCCSGKELSNCCLAIISGRNAQNPEQLMRSRFSAYMMKNYEYILATYSPPQRPQLSIKELERSAEGIRWLKLDVLEASQSKQLGTVEFVASYYADSDFYYMHEYSYFEKIDEKWFYVKGLSKDKTGKYCPGRNEQCPCGSGKKFKKCCFT
ncbi:MAG: SEC-C motif-containing protein [Arenicella sp.]